MRSVPAPSRSHGQRDRVHARMLRLLAGAFLAATVAVTLLASERANAAEPLLRFEDGIGSQPLRAGAQPNDVFGINPGGRPWVIARLSADVASDAFAAGIPKL